MAKMRPLQTQFGAGVLTPRFFGRTETPGYKAGCAELDNFIILRQGPADKRFGFNLMHQYPESVTVARLMAFQVDNISSYPVAICNNGKIYVFDNGTTHEFTHTFVEAELHSLQFMMQPGAPVMYIVSRGHSPAKLALAAGVFTYTDVVTFTAKPAAWTGANWPGAITFYQGRMWLAGTPNEGSTFWGSVSGGFENFTAGSLAADAIVYTIGRRGAIQWMSGASDLVFGTENAELIAKSEGAILKTGDIDVKPQSYMGSRRTIPIQVGNKVNFVSPDGRKVYQMGYRWTDNGWIAQDLTFTSENITANGKGAREIHWAQNPEQLMYVVCDNGRFFGATRDIENDIIGWYNYLTDGFVESAGVLEVNGISTVWMLVKRELNGATRMYLERISTVHYLDGAEVVTSPTDITSVTIARFANEEMTCTVDGAMHPKLQFDNTGHADLAFPGKVIIVGFPYSARLKTVPYAAGESENSVISAGKRWNRITVRLQDSRMPIINGQRPPERQPSTPMNTPEPGVSLLDAEIRNLGWDGFAQIDIVQDLPVSCRVLSIFGEVNLEAV